MLVALRHGQTALDTPDAKGALQGWGSLIGLNDDGQALAQNAAVTLRELPFTKIYSSDIIRCIQTAEEISGRFHMTPEFHPCFRSWDIGDLAGKPYAAIETIIHTSLQHPTKKVPGGESPQNFLDRYMPAVLPLVAAKQVYLLITHSHNVDILVSLAKTKGKTVDLGVLATPCEVEPGGILIVNRDWQYTILNPPKELISRPKRATKAAVLYLHRPDGDYRCQNCLLFIPGDQRCAVHGPHDEIKPSATCGLFVHGTPLTGLLPMSAVNKIESGYTEARTSCARCEYFLKDRKDCQKVDPESEGDDPGTIEPGACCNSWSEGK